MKKKSSSLQGLPMGLMNAESGPQLRPVDWREEGIVLDLSSSQMSYAVR